MIEGSRLVNLKLLDDNPAAYFTIITSGKLETGFDATSYSTDLIDINLNVVHFHAKDNYNPGESSAKSVEFIEKRSYNFKASET